MPSPTSPPEPPPAPPRRGRRTVFLLVLSAIVLSVLYPLRQYGASKEELRALVRRESQIEAQTRELQRQKDRLSSDAEVERLAREHLNMVKLGEYAFSITGRAPSPTPLPAAKPPAKKAEKRSWYNSFWNWLTSG